MGTIKDYTGRVLEYKNQCPACAYNNGEFEIPCGIAYEDDICIINQDWEIPINGFFILSVKRHIELFEELTDTERNHVFQLISRLMKILRDNNIVHKFNVLFEEKTGYHFHIWILPRDGWKEIGIDPTKDYRKLVSYAKEHFYTNENFQKILDTNVLLRKEMIIC